MKSLDSLKPHACTLALMVLLLPAGARARAQAYSVGITINGAQPAQSLQAISIYAPTSYTVEVSPSWLDWIFPVTGSIQLQVGNTWYYPNRVYWLGLSEVATFSVPGPSSSPFILPGINYVTALYMPNSASIGKFPSQANWVEQPTYQSLTISASSSTYSYGSRPVVTALVSGGITTGNVDFDIDGSYVAAVNVNWANHKAGYTLPVLARGTHSIQAYYPNTGVYGNTWPGYSNIVRVTVN